MNLYTTGTLQTPDAVLREQGWDLTAVAQEADVVFVRYDTTPPASLGTVRAVCTNMSDPQWSVDHCRVFTTRDIPAGLLFGITPTIEHTWGLIHAAHRRMPLDAWGSRDKHIAPKMLSRSTIGILGLGRIGYGVMRVAHSFGMRVKTRERNATEPLAEWVRDLDVLAVCIGRQGNEGTVVDEDVLQALPRNAIVVNTAYGEAVDVTALCGKLCTSELWAAGLDVLPKELDEMTRRMIDMLQGQRLFVTPHIAGSTRDARQETEQALLRVVRMWLESEGAAFA